MSSEQHQPTALAVLGLRDTRQPRSRLCVRCDALRRPDTRRLGGARAAAPCTVTSNGRASDAAAVTPLARALMRRARGGAAAARPPLPRKPCRVSASKEGQAGCRRVSAVAAAAAAQPVVWVCSLV